MTFEPEALIAVECNSYEWVRFIFTGVCVFLHAYVNVYVNAVFPPSLSLQDASQVEV